MSDWGAVKERQTDWRGHPRAVTRLGPIQQHLLFNDQFNLGRPLIRDVFLLPAAIARRSICAQFSSSANELVKQKCEFIGKCDFREI